jgi:hypothetical protein
MQNFRISYVHARGPNILITAIIILCGLPTAASFALAPPTLRAQAVPLMRIVPKQMQAEFSRRASTQAWTDYLYSPSNKKLYVLSLEPEIDVAKHVVGVDLVLRDAEKPKADENLLSPAGNWHGLQPYDFDATDAIHGAEGTVFGANRSIKVTNRQLNVVIHILDIRTRPLPDGTQELELLKLAVSVDNSPNS